MPRIHGVFMDLEPIAGSVAPGRFADLLVVAGDPLTDIRDLRKLTTVYKGGVEYKPPDILATLPANPNYRTE